MKCLDKNMNEGPKQEELEAQDVLASVGLDPFLKSKEKKRVIPRAAPFYTGRENQEQRLSQPS